MKEVLLLWSIFPGTFPLCSNINLLCWPYSSASCCKSATEHLPWTCKGRVLISGENKYSVGCLWLSFTQSVVSCALHGPCNHLEGMIFIWWIAIHKSFHQCDLCLILRLHFVCSISCSGVCGSIVCSNHLEEVLFEVCCIGSWKTVFDVCFIMSFHLILKYILCMFKSN